MSWLVIPYRTFNLHLKTVYLFFHSNMGHRSCYKGHHNSFCAWLNFHLRATYPGLSLAPVKQALILFSTRMWTASYEFANLAMRPAFSSCSTLDTRLACFNIPVVCWRLMAGMTRNLHKTFLIWSTTWTVIAIWRRGLNPIVLLNSMKAILHVDKWPLHLLGESIACNHKDSLCLQHDF